VLVIQSNQNHYTEVYQHRSLSKAIKTWWTKRHLAPHAESISGETASLRPVSKKESELLGLYSAFTQAI
jgi:hypothetical protein